MLTVAASMLAGGSFIADAARLRSGSAGAVLPFDVVAPSTLGTFLRSFAFGHLRQFDKAAEMALSRAWSAGAAPRAAEMTVNVDSTVCEVHGKSKQGAAYGHTKVLGCHPPARCETTPARFCTPGCGRARPSAAMSGSRMGPSPGWGAWRRARG